MNVLRAIAVTLALVVILPAPQAVAVDPADVDEAAIGLYRQSPSDWLGNGRTYAEQRYSPLARIDASNVNRLGLAWQAGLDSPVFGIEATPVEAGGILYMTSSYSRVYAFDARTGAKLWFFDPKVPRDITRSGCCFPSNRGVALWKGKVYVAAYDGRLFALDARSGQVEWQVDTTGGSPYYTITGAPRVVDGKVVIGNGGADFGTRGFFSAYDADTGRMAWRFYVVPDDPSKPNDQPELAVAARTWDADNDWSRGGDGNPWDSFSYDPEAGLLYVGTGNGGYLDQPQNLGKGDKLFVTSILAIHVKTGRLAWYYQTTPGDLWDYDATQNMVLAELEVDGQPRKVLMQASKNGYFYVLDRITGRLLSAQNFVRVNWARGIDLRTGRPIPNPEANYAHGSKLVFPSGNGAHNWQGMAFDPTRRLVYIPARDSGMIYSTTVPTWFHQGMDLSQFPNGDWVAGTHGALIAWDPVQQKPAWQVAHKKVFNGGVLATAGGFVAQGTQDGHLFFYASDDGRLLHDVFTGTGIVAPPISYEVDDVQYIAFAAGWTGFDAEPIEPKAPPAYVNDGRLIVLKLGGAKVPLAPRKRLAPFIAQKAHKDPALVARGANLFTSWCGICHGHVGEQTVAPDLRHMSAASYANFDHIVLGGWYKNVGMAAFNDVLNAADVDAIRAFLVDWAQRSARGEPSASRMPAPPASARRRSGT
jgi:quinohemoprotein ethanol dehydrogenase